MSLLTLKIRSRSAKSKHFFSKLASPNDVSAPVWSKSGHWFRRQSAAEAVSKLYDLGDLEN